MRRVLFPLLFFLFFFLPLFSESSEEWVMIQEDIRVLDIGRRSEITLSDPSLVSIEKISPLEIQIKAQKQGSLKLQAEGPGLSPLTLNIHITSKKQQERWQNIQDRIRNVHGIELIFTQEQLSIKGRTLTPEDRDLIREIASQHPDVINLSVFDKKLWQETLGASLQSRLSTPLVQVYVNDNALLLEGQVPDENTKQNVAQKLKTFLPETLRDFPVTNLIKVKPYLVNIEVTFLQVTRQHGENRGLNVLKNLEGAASLSWINGSPDQNIVVDASTKIGNLIRKGWGEILSHPKITVLSGSEGRFHDGGRRFIEGGSESSPLEIDYGLLLKVTPLILENSQIRLKVSLEISAPTEPSGRDFTRFNTETDVICPLGKSLVLSGLAGKLESRFQEKTPLLGDIPLLKAFFATKQHEKNEKDLLLLITPRLPQIEKELAKEQVRFRSLQELIRKEH
jgi:Flp pilus assembly secretin CpaC